MCGKPYEQVLENATADYLQHTAEIDKTVRERNLKRQANVTGLQKGVKAFNPTGMSQAAACDGLKDSFNIGNTNQQAQGSLVPLIRD